MAETLRAGVNGTNGPAPLTEDEFLSFVTRLSEAESDHGAAREACKAPAKKVKSIREEIAQKMPIVAFDRMREDLYKPGGQRIEEDRMYRICMAMMGKPMPSVQTEIDFTVRPAGAAEVLRIETEGHKVGRDGNPAEGNHYTPGEERYAAWANGWARGHDEFVTEQARLAGEMGDPAPKRRGRPAGSRNKPKDEGADAATKH